MTNIKGKMIIKKFKERLDPRQICRICGFKDTKELGEYMRRAGYIWDPKKDNYKEVDNIDKEESLILSWGNENKIMPDINSNINLKNIDLEKYLPIFEVLYEKQNILYKILSENEIDSYELKGINVRKTITIDDLLNRLVMEYATEENLNIQEIIEEALIYYLRSKGYENKVKSLFRNYNDI